MGHIPVKYACLERVSCVLLISLLGASMLGGCRLRSEEPVRTVASETEQITEAFSENGISPTAEDAFLLTDEKQLKLLQEAAAYPKTEKIPGVMEDGESFLLHADEKERAYMMEQAKGFLRTKYEVDHHDLQQLDEVVAFHRNFCSYFLEDLLWKTDQGEVMLIQELVSEYWTVLTKTKTVMQAHIISQDDLFYHNGEDIWRGIVAIKIMECEDMEALEAFLGFPKMELNQEYYGIYEIAFRYRSSILDEDTILDPDRAKRKLYIAREGCIGEWKAVSEQ